MARCGHRDGCAIGYALRYCGMDYELTGEYFAQARQRAMRFCGCLDAGTSGTLAADVLRLLAYIEHHDTGGQTMTDEQPKTPRDWIIRGERELKERRTMDDAPPRALGDGLTATAEESPAEELLRSAADTSRERRANYSPPREHFARTVGAINAIFAHKLREPLTASDWAMVMILDKCARYQGDRKTRDQIVDIAGYAGCLAECETELP